MNQFYLIYHPTRQKTIVGNLTIHHDKFGGNEDPYIWNDRFLHTYCHITQLPNEVGQINFWISGDNYPHFTKLFCDCVFFVNEKQFWSANNFINRLDPIVDNQQTFNHHYVWANKGHHPLKKRKRYTLKADPEKSFQPQAENGCLIDILPFLNQNGLTTEKLINSITSKMGSRPFYLEAELGKNLYQYLVLTSTIKIIGKQLKDLHPNKFVK